MDKIRGTHASACFTCDTKININNDNENDDDDDDDDDDDVYDDYVENDKKGSIPLSQLFSVYSCGQMQT